MRMTDLFYVFYIMQYRSRFQILQTTVNCDIIKFILQFSEYQLFLMIQFAQKCIASQCFLNYCAVFRVQYANMHANARSLNETLTTVISFICYVKPR